MNDSEFDHLLRAARGQISLPPDFQHEVWQRIEAAPSVRLLKIAKFPPLISAVEHPWGAIAGIAAMITLGVWLGYVTAPEVMDAKSAYAESISPFGQLHKK